MIKAPSPTVFCNQMQTDYNIDEAKLIHDLKKGDVSAFTSIYHLYFQRIYAYCFQFCKSKHEAEDIVQEAFEQLWCNRGKITSEQSLNSLLYVMTRNFLVKAYRRNINSPIFEDYINYRNAIGQEDASKMEYFEFVETVKKCILNLPKSQQEVVRLSKLESLSNKEIASQLGITEQSVKNYLSQGLKLLRAKLKAIISIIVIMLILS